MVKWRCRGNEIVIEGSSEHAISDESSFRLYSADARDLCRTLKANPGNSGIINDMQNREIHLIEQMEEEMIMLGDRDVVATIAVKDLPAAKKFYADTLGLTAVGGEGQEVIVFRSGKSTVNVYRSQYAGTNKATAATWVVGEDVDNIVRELKAKGVKFEHYDFPGMKREGDVHVAGKIRNAWFKDPDGNILSVVNG